MFNTMIMGGAERITRIVALLRRGARFIAHGRAVFAILVATFALCGALSHAQLPSDAGSRSGDPLPDQYLQLTRGWAEQAVFTPAEERAMQAGRQREKLMATSLDDALGAKAIANGEPSFESLSALYPGKILDRTVLGSYSDPTQPAEGSNEEFVLWWNGAISANLLTRRASNGSTSAAENTNILFRVGQEAEMFGKVGTRYTRLRYEDGYLPIVQAGYTAGGVRYTETAFADRVPNALQDTAYVRMEMKNESGVARSAELHEDFTLIDGSRVSVSGDAVLDASGNVVMAFEGGEASFDAGRQRLTHRVRLDARASAAVVFRIPYAPAPLDEVKQPAAADFTSTHDRVRELWRQLLAAGTQIRVPEKRVNDMWRALLLQNFVIADGPRFTYGSGLAYDNSYYPFESGFASVTMARYGYGKDAEAWLNYLIPASVEPKRAGYRYQNRRAMPLFLLYEAYRLNGHSDYFEKNKETLYRVAEEIISDRHSTMTTENGVKPRQWGLLPPARPGVDARAAQTSDYVVAHDITNCQGLQAFGEFLVETGIDVARGKRYLNEAADFRSSIVQALKESVIRAPGKPPFVPLETLYVHNLPNHEAQPYENLAEMQGSYYHYWADMELHYDFFNPDDPLAHWLVDYLQQRGGFVLGCTRARGRPESPYGWINDNYNAGFYSYALRRGQVGRFLLGFYSRLAFDSSRYTYVNSEASPFIGYNTRDGGLVGAEYSFPNSASNAETLDLLRFMLILEERNDGIDTGVIDVARGTPRDWLEDGKKIMVERAPTDFGTISFSMESKLREGIISADIQAPRREKFRAIRLYLRAPYARTLKRVRVNGKPYRDFNAAEGYVTLPAGPAEFRVQAEYR